jgi:hypothetical protein
VDVVDLDSVAAAESIQLAYALGGIGFAVHETHPVEFGVKIVSTKEVLLSTVHVRDAELVDVDREVPRRLRLRDVPSLRLASAVGFEAVVAREVVDRAPGARSSERQPRISAIAKERVPSGG